jgi:hypothetical protein
MKTSPVPARKNFRKDPFGKTFAKRINDPVDEIQRLLAGESKPQWPDYRECSGDSSFTRRRRKVLPKQQARDRGVPPEIAKYPYEAFRLLGVPFYPVPLPGHLAGE